MFLVSEVTWWPIAMYRLLMLLVMKAGSGKWKRCKPKIFIVVATIMFHLSYIRIANSKDSHAPPALRLWEALFWRERGAQLRFAASNSHANQVRMHHESRRLANHATLNIITLKRRSISTPSRNCNSNALFVSEATVDFKNGIYLEY